MAVKVIFNVLVSWFFSKDGQIQAEFSFQINLARILLGRTRLLFPGGFGSKTAMWLIVVVKYCCQTSSKIQDKTHYLSFPSKTTRIFWCGAPISRTTLIGLESQLCKQDTGKSLDVESDSKLACSGASRSLASRLKRWKWQEAGRLMANMSCLHRRRSNNK